MSKRRDEIPEESKWNIQAMYSTEELWEADYKKASDLVSAFENTFKGHLGDGAETLAEAFVKYYEMHRLVSKVYTYASHRSDEDLASSHQLALKSRARSLYVSLGAHTSWFDPEILALPDETISAYRAHPSLAVYQRPLNEILRYKPHTLSPAEERILALADDPLGCASKAYEVLLDADTTFPLVKAPEGYADADAEGKIQLTRGNFIKLLESSDRAVRKEVYEAYYKEQAAVVNTYSALLDGQIRAHVFESRVRKHPSSLAWSLFGDNVDPKVYTSLIEAVHRAFPAFYRYVALRKRCLGVDKVAMYDVYVPLVNDVSPVVPFDKACEWLREALKPMGDDYLAIFEEARKERWMDVYENKGKRCGAYSGGCYDSAPYMLLNHNDTMDSAFTLVHEFGHSAHTYLSNKNQPYHLSEYKIFVAEVASTVNEMLLHHYLLGKVRGVDTPEAKAMRIYLLNERCNDFKATVFRQVMFAEFELLTHQKVEEGEALTADVLCEMYLNLNKAYFGEEVDSDKHISYEWTRIPHFYYNFYVYKYATSYCVAQKVAASIAAGEPGAVDRYKTFLKSGCTKDPMDLLRDILGIDLTDPKVVQDSLEIFGKTVDDLEKELFN